LRLNDVNDAVARMQRAFLDLGFQMPETTKKGAPDGQYGGETAAAVRRFQEENGVSPPGGHEAGKKTLTKLDEVFLKRDAPIEPSAPALKAVGVVSTNPAVETPDKKITKPDAQVTPTQVEPAPEAEKEHPLQIEIGGGLEGDIHLKEPPPTPEQPFACDQLKLKLDIKGNINVVKLGNRVTLLPNLGLAFNLVPLACGEGLGVEAHVDLLKLKLSNAIELGVMTSFEPTNGAVTGWIGKGGISFEAKPFKKIPLSVEAEGAAGVQRFPLGSSGVFVWLVSGGIGLKYEFGFF
jgi:peptidoglycan hydrolase-like protein with peptidoglycan-binding domain